MQKQIKITKAIARKVLATVDAGLVRGVGVPEPGKMCVEAAVCYAMGLPHGDEPNCVSPVLRALSKLNDAAWSSDQTRAKGLRRLALAQLGSADALDEKKFLARIVKHALTVSVPLALRAAASIHPKEEHKKALLAVAAKLEKQADRATAREAANAAANAAADAAADAAYAATRDKSLADYAEIVVQILIDLKAPGCRWLELTEAA